MNPESLDQLETPRVSRWTGHAAVFALLPGLVWSADVAAQSAQPRTASEIERALSVPAQPGLQLRGAPLHLRGPAGIVDDPTAAPSTPAQPVPASTDQSWQSLDYPTLVRDRPKVAAQIRFDVNSARIRPDAYPLLNEYASALQSPALGAAILLIAGHTDAAGSDAHNLLLSERRAQAVRDYLIRQGIAPNRLTAKGYGEAYPVASNATEADRELNRRSEFIRLDTPTMDNP
ncbi:MAG: OmpA-like protein [Pseudomonadota bacterium]|nr:OmpA-like protein [Pseudomonadota bacterium]